MRYITLTLLFAIISQMVYGQSYTAWISGDSSDVSTSHRSGIVLAGGGGDHDDAMRWLLRKADGGDIVVIRASGSDGYNPYFYAELGVTVNSVTTIRFDSASAAFNDFVLETLRGAEMLFIAGGDQTIYHQYWHNTPVQETLQYLIHEKKIAVGGTSAGMAILGHYAYLPATLGVTSEEALANPFHPYMENITTENFLNIPYLDGVITDTHFDQRERAGRTVSFLSRLVGDGLLPRAIAVNEYTAVAIDEDGLAWVYGDYPAYDDYAYFMQTNCNADDIMPERLQSNEPLHWSIERAALKVYRVAGNSAGSRYFDLNSWNDGRGGSWQDWWVDNGVLQRIPDVAPPCVVAGTDHQIDLVLKYHERTSLEVVSERMLSHLILMGVDGRIIESRTIQKSGSVLLPLQAVHAGILILHLEYEDGSTHRAKFFHH